MRHFDYKCNKIAGFFLGTLRMGYSLDDAWQLMQTSEEGQGILQDDEWYCVHVQGISSAKMADKKNGHKYIKNSILRPTVREMELLAKFIEGTHIKYNIPYSKIFSKYSIGEFYKKCGNVLGNYDDKLVRAYLL